MKAKERRRYFRVDDEVILAWRILSPEEIEKRLQHFMQGEIEAPDATRLYLKLESDITLLLNQLKGKEPEIAHIIQLLNRKLNLFARGAPVGTTQQSILDEQTQSVNISACGIAFMSEEKLIAGSDIQIEMVLLPEKSYILSYGTVIGCEKNDSKHSERPYRVNVDFVAMRETDVDKLIQHIMQREMQMLKQRKKMGKE